MRVALVTPRFPPAVGGVERYVAWLAEALLRAGHEPTVITSGTTRRTVRGEHPGPAGRTVPVIRLGTWATVSNTPLSPAWPWQLRGLLRELQPEVVNAHAPVPGLADLAAFTSTAPVVLTYHAGSLVKGGHRADPLLRVYERRVLPRVFARCAALVSVSPVALTHHGGHSTLVPPGVDVERFVPPRDGLPRETRVLYAGRVERTSRWKGLQVLVEALPALRRAVPTVRLSVVGSGDDVVPLQKRAAELGVADVIDWHGEIPHDELPAHYQRAGVTVLPSLTEAESFGMTLVEAMASGCPVVGSRVGGIPFVVREGVDGLLVPPADAQQLARALAEVLTDPVRARELGAAGREAAEQRWSWAHQEQRMLQVLTDAARGTGEGSPR